jgi:hypothetical protein
VGKFKTGQSGNLRGRPKGALNKATRAAQELLNSEAQTITRKAVDLAIEGNPVALRLCLERILPPRKDRPVSIGLPKVERAGDITKALSTILAAVAQGEITPTEALDLAGLVELLRRGIETGEIEDRLQVLEEGWANRRE